MKVGIIGLGNMGSAIVEGLLFKNIVSKDEIYAIGKNLTKLKEKALKLGINSCDSIKELMRSVDVIIIATPANIFLDIIKEIKGLAKGKLVISVCSGSSSIIVNAVYPSMQYISMIPSTPIRYAEGIVIAEKNNNLNTRNLELFHNLFKDVALIKYLDDILIDIASTISGCGPAFIAMLIEALGDAACKYGLDRKTSYELISKMLIGTGTSYLKGNKHPGMLKDEVASPGGTTILGITKLEECGFRNSLIKAVDAISYRTK